MLFGVLLVVGSYLSMKTMMFLKKNERSRCHMGVTTPCSSVGAPDCQFLFQCSTYTPVD